MFDFEGCQYDPLKETRHHIISCARDTATYLGRSRVPKPYQHIVDQYPGFPWHELGISSGGQPWPLHPQHLFLGGKESSM